MKIVHTKLLANSPLVNSALVNSLLVNSLLVWAALGGAAQAQGKMNIEVVGGEKAEADAVPTISNASIRDKDEAPARVELGPGEVYFKFDEADLTTDVLPLFQSQVGLRIRYRGPARAVTLRLTAPMRWEQALDLVARFSNTHLKRGANGKLELRNRFGGKSESRYDDLDGQVDLVVQRPKRRSVKLPPRNIPRVRLQVLASAPRRTSASVGSSRQPQTSRRQTQFRQLPQNQFRQPRNVRYTPPRQNSFRPTQQTRFNQPQQTQFRPPQQSRYRPPQQSRFRQTPQTQFR